MLKILDEACAPKRATKYSAYRELAEYLGVSEQAVKQYPRLKRELMLYGLKSKKEMKMNKFKKYCANVFVMESEEKYNKGDIATVTTQYGKEVEVEVYNYLGKNLYSVTILESKSYAERRAEKYQKSAELHEQKSLEWYEKSKEGKDFLALAEPIKIGHHSEHRHRALIDRNWERIGNSVKEYEIAKEKRKKAEYWEGKEKEINLSMPESLEYYTDKYNKAKEYHQGLKDGSIPKEHSYSMQYANKAVKDAEKNKILAQTLWG